MKTPPKLIMAHFRYAASPQFSFADLGKRLRIKIKKYVRHNQETLHRLATVFTLEVNLG